jgi:protein TonB
MKRACLLMIVCCVCSSLALVAPAAWAEEQASRPPAKTKPKAKAAAKKKKTKKPRKATPAPKTEVLKDQAAIAAATDAYKKELAQKIAQASTDRMFAEQPQALLRSVVVLEFTVDADGKLLKSAVRRSNHDPETEAAALASLRDAAPLPKPPAALLNGGKLELHETWLFNNDGRFQIRSTAQPQLDRR